MLWNMLGKLQGLKFDTGHMSQWLGRLTLQPLTRRFVIKEAKKININKIIVKQTTSVQRMFIRCTLFYILRDMQQVDEPYMIQNVYATPDYRQNIRWIPIVQLTFQMQNLKTKTFVVRLFCVCVCFCCSRLFCFVLFLCGCFCILKQALTVTSSSLVRTTATSLASLPYLLLPVQHWCHGWTTEIHNR